MAGRSIRLFLVEGTPNGLRTAEFGLSTIKGVYVPRESLPAFSKRSESRRTGIYVLIGDDPEFAGRTKLYIGEGDDVLARLIAHDKDETKTFWNRAVVFVSKDENLTKAHVRHVEAKLIDLALRAKRCTVENKTGPFGGALPEADLAEMEEFIDQVRLLLATMGIDAFEEPSATATVQAGQPFGGAPEFQFGGQGFSAICYLGDGLIVVRKASRARMKTAPSLGASSNQKREELLSSGVLSESEGFYVFTQDYAFNSASAAAQVVSGTSVNGRDAWKLPNGKTLGSWQEDLLGAAQVIPGI